LVQSQVRFNRVPEKVPEKVPGGFGAEPGQVQQGSEERSGEGSGEGSGRLWCRARSGSTRLRRRFRRRSGRLWCRARSGSTGFRKRFRRRFREALVQSQVRFNRVPEIVPEKVPEKVPGGFGAEPGQVQQGSGKGSAEVSRKPWCKVKSGSTGSGEGCREGPREFFGNLWCRARSGSTGSTGFPALGFAARFRKICKNETLWL